jgi:hypothetical protein
MPEDFDDVLNKVKECMKKVGDFVLGDNAVKDCNPVLMFPTEETLFEHWQIYQGSMAYYGYLLNEAQSHLRDAEDNLQKVTLKHRARVNQLTKEKYGISRPTKEELLIISVLENPEEVEPAYEEVKYWQRSVRCLETWLKSWDKKSFILNGMTNAVMPTKPAANERRRTPLLDPEG